MIQLLTNLKVADNTGAKIVECIHVYGASKKKTGQIGDVIMAVVKEAEPRRPVKKHDKVKAVIVRQRKAWRRADGSYLSFADNACVVLEQSKDPKGTRVFGPLPRELKEMGFDKITNLAEELV